MLEKSQGEHNKLDCQIFFPLKVPLIILCFIVQNLMQIDDVSKVLLHVPNYYAQWILFFQTSFFLSNVHHSFSKLERILTLIIIFKST